MTSRLAARLRKLEHVRSSSKADLSSLTDGELISGLRATSEGIGIDWSAFKIDPMGETRRKMKSPPDNDDLLAALERSARKLGEDGLNELMTAIEAME